MIDFLEQSELTSAKSRRNLRRELLYILEDKAQCSRFMEFLIKRKCEENLKFWLDVRLYKHPKETPENSLVEIAQYP